MTLCYSAPAILLPPGSMGSMLPDHDSQENLEKLMFAWSLPSKTLCAWDTLLVRTRYSSWVTSCGPQYNLGCLNTEGRVKKLCSFLILSMSVWVLSVSHSVLSDSLQPHGLERARLLCPCDSPGKNTGVGGNFLLQGIFLTQGSNPGLLHCRQILYHLSQQGSLVSNWLSYSKKIILPL